MLDSTARLFMIYALGAFSREVATAEYSWQATEKKRTYSDSVDTLEFLYDLPLLGGIQVSGPSLTS